MKNPTTPTERAKPQSKGWIIRILEAWQWLVALFYLLLLVVLMLSATKLTVPGAPVVLFWATIGIGGVIVLAHTPPLFMWLPRNGRTGVYIASFAYFMLFGMTFDGLQSAWERTPQGAAEAKRFEAERKVELAEGATRRAQEEKLHELQGLQEQLANTADKLEACFTTFGHRLPELESSVKESLHNPSAFEHVETIAIVPDAAKNTVAMTFRAENGFGAVRTYVVKASVYPEDCGIAAIGEPELM